MAFPGAHIDARNSTFYDIHGNQYNQYVNNVLNTGVEPLREFLQPVDRRGYYPTTCLAGTRVDIFEKINHWLESREGPNILLITGSPGAGKSSIASSMDAKLRQEDRLGASFYFRHDSVELSDPGSVWRTVAFDLSQFHTKLLSSLLRISEQRKVEPMRPDIDLHFTNLVQNILVDNQSDLSLKPPVIILDALDESSESSHRKSFVGTLARWAKLPGDFKLLVTSRNEKLPASFLKLCVHIDIPSGPSVSPEAQQDIHCFLVDGFTAIKEEDDFLDPGWPREDILQALTTRSAGLFIWAKTALDFIQSGPPTELLDAILAGEAVKGDIDALYKRVLELSFSNVRYQELQVVRSVLSIILLSKIPVPLHELHNFLGGGISQASVRFVLKRLSSVVSIGSTDGALRVCHLSFAEFLFDITRCGPTFSVDKASQSEAFLHSCLNFMQRMLQFNICEIGSSYNWNGDIPKEQIESHIPWPLSYSCIFWASHLEDTAPLNVMDQLTSELVLAFLKSHLLYWLEVMSLLKQIQSASAAFSRIAAAYKGVHPEIEELARDARKFISVFCIPISKSVPHIYLSALPLSPQKSRIYENYIQHYPNTISLSCGAESYWPATSHIIEGHNAWVISLAYSPDGKHIASGSADKTVRVWDVETGEILSGPFQGHEDWVTSLAYSPDGKHIASESLKVVRIWDIKTGAMMSGPFDGCTDSITSLVYSTDGMHIALCSTDGTSITWDIETGKLINGPPFETLPNFVTYVAYSPDGTHVAEASILDHTIKICDVETGEVVSGPLQGHTNSVSHLVYAPSGKQLASSSWDHTVRIWDLNTAEQHKKPKPIKNEYIESVAYSPDGRHIASGSEDKTVRVWDVNTGEMVSSPFEGHRDWVTSVAYSPDGKCIVSGSWDKTVRIWDLYTGKCVSGPLEGHNGRVLSVAYCPLGQHIASASEDETIRIWNVRTGKTILTPFEGHTSYVVSIAYSPDGKHIASGSGDKTVRIWNAKTGQLVSGPFIGHSQSVTSVAYSPDLKHVASGSQDKTVRIWDIETGEIVSEPFKGHSAYVFCVAYSPDGKYVASGSLDKTVRVWDVNTGLLSSGPFEGHKSDVTCLAYSPDGKYIVSGSHDKTLRIWNASQDKVNTQIELDSSDGRLKIPHPACQSGFTLDPLSNWLYLIGDFPMFWAPHYLSDGLCGAETAMNFGAPFRQLDLSRFVHGCSWAACREVKHKFCSL